MADWLRRPIEEIKGRDIRELVREKAQTSPVSANRLLSFVKRVFRWASSQDYVDADPAAAVSKPGKESVRERFLSEDEIRLVWKAAGRLGYPAGHIVRLALVTGQRRGEIAGLRRSELGRLEYRMADPRTGRDTMASGEAWLLPAERTKRGVAHAVPLSKLALSIIAEAPELEISGEKFDHVFATGKVGDTPTSGWSTYKSRLDAEIGKIMAQETKEEFALIDAFVGVFYDCHHRRVVVWLPAWVASFELHVSASQLT